MIERRRIARRALASRLACLCALGAGGSCGGSVSSGVADAAAPEGPGRDTGVGSVSSGVIDAAGPEGPGRDGGVKGVGSVSEASELEAASSEAEVTVDGGDAGTCLIEVPWYDQHCSVDSDCVELLAGFHTDLGGPDGLLVQSGNYCTTMCICGGEAINKSAVAQYMMDVSKTPLVSGAIPPPSCGCLPHGGACCRSGRCVGLGCPGLPQDAGLSGE
jgi:hypothetical protein